MRVFEIMELSDFFIQKFAFMLFLSERAIYYREEDMTEAYNTEKRET